VADGGEMHPAELVTVKVYVPATRFKIVVLVPDPVDVTPPGERIRVQDPVDGNPVNDTLPVDIVQVGWVMIPRTGAWGDEDCALIITLADATEVHPAALVTVNV
jgi:hypothetical protein